MPLMYVSLGQLREWNAWRLLILLSWLCQLSGREGNHDSDFPGLPLMILYLVPCSVSLKHVHKYLCNGNIMEAMNSSCIVCFSLCSCWHLYKYEIIVFFAFGDVVCLLSEEACTSVVVVGGSKLIVTDSCLPDLWLLWPFCCCLLWAAREAIDVLLIDCVGY